MSLFSMQWRFLERQKTLSQKLKIDISFSGLVQTLGFIGFNLFCTFGANKSCWAQQKEFADENFKFIGKIFDNRARREKEKAKGAG